MLLSVLVLQAHAHAILVPGKIPPSAAQLQSDLDAAIAARVPKFTIPPGEYRFNDSNASLIIDGATDIEIVGTGATVWLSPGSLVHALSSRRTTIRGLTVDFSPPCFSQGVVRAVDTISNSILFDVDPGFLPPVPSQHLQFGAAEVKVIWWDATTRLLKTR